MRENITSSGEELYNKSTVSSYENLICRINEVKNKVEKFQYINKLKLKNDIDNLSRCIWSGLENIYTFNLSNICKIHEFLIDEIIKIHNEEENFRNEELLRSNLNIKEIKKQCIDGTRGSRIYLLKDSSYEYYFIGDIHSDDFIIKRILNKCNFFEKIVKGEKIRLVFLGDYVDRGKEHLKTIEKIMILKYIFPGNIYLLKGNHDGGFIENNNVKLCIGKPVEDKDEDYFILFLDILTKNNKSFSRNMITRYLDLFNSMAIISIIMIKEEVILGVHGGLPRPKRMGQKAYEYINAIYDLTNESIQDNIGKTIVQNILWSDPLRYGKELRENSGRFRFKEDEFYEFCSMFGIDILIRGHEAHENGCEEYFNDKVYSVFSSGCIMEDSYNINFSTAYEYVKPKIIKVNLKDGIQVLPIK
ncbi:MAG: metallophosphoesterase family protein [Clostridium sp.]